MSGVSSSNNQSASEALSGIARTNRPSASGALSDVGFYNESPKGFIENLRSPLKLMQEESLPANIIKWLTGSNESERVDPVTTSLSNTLSEMEAQGLQDTAEYQNTLQLFHGTKAILDADEPGFSWDGLKAAFQDDPGAMAAEFVNALMADPELMLAPVGWERAAAMATTRVGKVAAGAAGTSAAAAGITAPIIAADQLANEGEINPEALAEQTLLASVAAPILVGGFKGVSAIAKRAAKQDQAIMGELSPSVGAAAVVTEEVIETAATKGPSLIDDAVDVIGGKAVTPVRQAGEVAPSIARIARIMEPDEEVRHVSNIPEERVSHFERVSEATGRFIGQIEDALLPHITKFNPLNARKKIPCDVGKDIVKGLRGQAYPAALRDTVKAVRQVLDDVAEYSKAAGIHAGYIDDYFPRIYRAKLLASDDGAREFTRVLMKHDIDAVSADEIIQRIVNEDGILDFNRIKITEDNIESAFFAQAGRRTPIGGEISGRKAHHLEMSRKLKHIPDEELAPFLENDLYPVITRYTENAIRRAEWVRSFGIEGGKLANLARQGVRESREAGMPVHRKQVKRIFDLADALQGNYHPIQSRAAARANTFVSSYQLLRTLPLATISSLSEPFIVLLRGDLKPALKAVPSVINHVAREAVRVVHKGIRKAQATRALEDVGLGLDAALAERLTAAFGGEATAVTSAFFKLNLLHDFTKFNRVLANETGKHMVEGYLRDLSKRGAEGLAAGRKQRILRELGVDPEQGLAWLRKGGDRADPFYESIRMAGLRFTDQVVMNPRATNRPMWHSNPHFRLVSQLKGFQTVFGNTVVKRLYDELTKKGLYDSATQAGKVATVAPLMLLTAALGNEIREYIKYGEKGNPKFKNESPAKTLIRAVDRTGFTGVMQFGLDAALAHRFGSTGLGSILGPTASQIEQTGKGLGQLSAGKTTAIEKAVVNAIPGANFNKETRSAIKDAIPF